MSCNCTESKMCLACGPAKSAKHRPSDTGGAIPTWQERLQQAHPQSEAEHWPAELKVKYMALELADRAALASKGDTGGDLSAAAFEDIFESWDGCMYDAPGENIDIGAALRIDIGKLLATAPRAAIPARDAALEEAAQAVVGMGSTDPIMSYGQLCAEAIRALKGVAAIPAAGSSAAGLTVKLTEMRESNGNVTWSVLLAKSDDAQPWDCHSVYSDTIKGRAEYERDSLKHFLGLGPEPDMLAYDTDAPTATKDRA